MNARINDHILLGKSSFAYMVDLSFNSFTFDLYLCVPPLPMVCLYRTSTLFMMLPVQCYATIMPRYNQTKISFSYREL